MSELFGRNKTITFVVFLSSLQGPFASLGVVSVINQAISDVANVVTATLGDATPGSCRAIHFNPVCQRVHPTPPATSHHLISYRRYQEKPQLLLYRHRAFFIIIYPFTLSQEY